MKLQPPPPRKRAVGALRMPPWPGSKTRKGLSAQGDRLCAQHLPILMWRIDAPHACLAPPSETHSSRQLLGDMIIDGAVQTEPIMGYCLARGMTHIRQRSHQRHRQEVGNP